MIEYDDAKPLAQRMRHDLERYRSLRQYTERDSEFHKKLVHMQKWQVERMKLTHHELLASKKYHAATEFFLNDIYGGIDLSDLANEIERAMNAAFRILPENVMKTAAIALELNALTGELDEALAHLLFEEYGLEETNHNDYVKAFYACNNHKLRVRQAELARAMGAGLDKYVRSRMIYTTFKIVKKPAHMAKLGTLYDFMGKGFDVMRPMGNASTFINKLVDQEELIIRRIFAGDHRPYQNAHIEELSLCAEPV